MKIISNQNMMQRLSDLVVATEMSNIASIVATPTILSTWYVIDPDMSETVKGWKNITDYIGEDSELRFSKIENVPLYGLELGQQVANWDTEHAAFDEDFSTQCAIYPNTIFPLPGSMFTVHNSEVPALYIVTDMKPSTVRTNPFMEITLRLFTRDPMLIAYLDKYQVIEGEYYTTMLSAIGNHKSLVIKKDILTDLDGHLDNYLDLIKLYSMLFYDRSKAAFVFDGFPGPYGTRNCYVDLTLWRFMFDEGIVIYDDLVTYANNNRSRTIERVYTSSPDIYVDDHAYERSIIYRLYHKDETPSIQRKSFDTYRYPSIYEPTNQMTKYQGQNIWYLETYERTPSDIKRDWDFYLFDDEFLCRIRQNNKYEEFPITHGVCDGCENRCIGAPVRCYNPYLRNAIISYYNEEEIDWNSLMVSDDRTIENYYLIPIVLGIYKKYIQGMV